MASSSLPFLSDEEHDDLQRVALAAIATCSSLDFPTSTAWAQWCQDVAIAARLMLVARVHELIEVQTMRVERIERPTVG